jgi:BlaI family penicillinase repressor
MKKKAAPALSPAQMELMELVWERGQIGVAEAWKALSARRPVARNTVQTTLARLHERGWLHASEEGNAFVYRPAREREGVVARMLERLIDTAFGGSHSDLVAAVVESPRLSSAEAERIRAIIDAAAPRRPGKRR